MIDRIPHNSLSPGYQRAGRPIPPLPPPPPALLEMPSLVDIIIMTVLTLLDGSWYVTCTVRDYTCNGLGHQVNIFKSALFLYMHKCFFILFLACLGQEIKNVKFQLASLKTLTNSKKLFRKSHHISVPAFRRFKWLIFYSVQVQFSGSQAAFRTIVRVT